MEVAIIIASRNRANDLAATLTALNSIDVPETWSIEIIIVDNGSKDETPSIIEAFKPSKAVKKHLVEPQPGKSRALNRAIAVATAEILVFIDDDIEPQKNWLPELCKPILANEADAVMGDIQIAPELIRDWMTATHQRFLASTKIWQRDEKLVLVGANMAIHRRVLDKVPEFDPNVGPGPAAGGEDTLFSFQVARAGFRIVRQPTAEVIHHFNADRLTRAAIAQSAQKGAVSDFYIRHHWLHEDSPRPLWLMIRSWMRLQYYRLRKWPEWWNHQSVPDWEKEMLQGIHRFWLEWKHRRDPRNYEQFGLVRKARK